MSIYLSSQKIIKDWIEDPPSENSDEETNSDDKEE